MIVFIGFLKFPWLSFAQVRNRVWANSGCDLRQSPAKNGR